MKVIFLDIDGVLNVYCQSRDEYGCIFHDHLVDNLKWVIEQTGAKIVVSSSWRLSGEKSIMDMWNFRNLPGEVIGITPNLSYGVKLNTYTPRGKEIQQWLDEHPEVTNYVIFDDDSDMLEHQMKNFICTFDNIDHPDSVDMGYGLTMICAEQAIKILKSN
jgi:hypothetical protein